MAHMPETELKSNYSDIYEMIANIVKDNTRKVKAYYKITKETQSYTYSIFYIIYNDELYRITNTIADTIDELVKVTKGFGFLGIGRTGYGYNFQLDIWLSFLKCLKNFGYIDEIELRNQNLESI